jgi:hypothetical protein
MLIGSYFRPHEHIHARLDAEFFPELIPSSAAAALPRCAALGKDRLLLLAWWNALRVFPLECVPFLREQIPLPASMVLYLPASPCVRARQSSSLA